MRPVACYAAKGKLKWYTRVVRSGPPAPSLGNCSKQIPIALRNVALPARLHLDL